ncbi:hypothetical protein ACET3X_001897 [Alternaria dauci]|uniref:Uncharacterized protein n=1 Tax=Alternaria dauci TaxID=48095 RepID=A0ABR3UYM9_9PLEO
MNISVSTDDIYMYDAPAMTDHKRRSKECIIRKTLDNKAHITRRPSSPRSEAHPAVRTNKTPMKTLRRMDTTPLPRSRVAQKPLGLRSKKSKSSWKTLLHAYMLEQFYIRVAEWRNARAALSFPHGVFGCPSIAFKLSTASTSSFGSSTGSDSTASTSGTSTWSSLVSGQSGAATVSGSSGSMTAAVSKPWTTDIEREDAPDPSTDHVAVAPSITITPISPPPPPPPSQPAEPANTTAVAPHTFAGLGFLPSRPCKSETVTPPKPASMSEDQVSAKSLSAPKIPNPGSDVAPPPAPPSQCEEAAKTSAELQSPALATGIEPVACTTQVEDTKPAVPPSSKDDTKSAESKGVIIPFPPMENSKSTVSPPSPPVANANAPTETSRQMSRPRDRALVTLVNPEKASKQEVELGMGSFASSRIDSPEAQVSAFSNPHFKQFFNKEMETLQTSLSD